ncbi:hypothetical protein DFH07DRAFT_784547 [Mycena maculata]|uniref:Uncharacterized protein n=1 Tax=Mycena maculata TaxID=230809 RepID=A0AAD7MK06_9AGAR|nr:hypothetical protein DFH07DRAFT_784547 [Mycena maculata]
MHCAHGALLRHYRDCKDDSESLLEVWLLEKGVFLPSLKKFPRTRFTCSVALFALLAHVHVGSFMKQNLARAFRVTISLPKADTVTQKFTEVLVQAPDLETTDQDSRQWPTSLVSNGHVHDSVNEELGINHASLLLPTKLQESRERGGDAS